MFYRRSRVQTGGKDGEGERAGPSTYVWWLRSQGLSPYCKGPLYGGVSTPCQVPNTEPRARKRILHCIWHLKICGTLSTWMRRGPAKNPGILLKGQCTGSCSQTLTQGSGRGKLTQGIWESQREDLGGVTPRNDPEDQTLRSLR